MMHIICSPTHPYIYLSARTIYIYPSNIFILNMLLVFIPFRPASFPIILHIRPPLIITHTRTPIQPASQPDQRGAAILIKILLLNRKCKHKSLRTDKNASSDHLNQVNEHHNFVWTNNASAEFASNDSYADKMRPSCISNPWASLAVRHLYIEKPSLWAWQINKHIRFYWQSSNWGKVRPESESPITKQGQ